MFGLPREKASDRLHHHDSLMFITFSIVAIDVLNSQTQSTRVRSSCWNTNTSPSHSEMNVVKLMKLKLMQDRIAEGNVIPF